MVLLLNNNTPCSPRFIISVFGPKERIFLTELGKSFKAEGAFWFKIPDSPIHAGMKTRFTVSKPFDALVIKEGSPIAIEGKC